MNELRQKISASDDQLLKLCEELNTDLVESLGLFWAITTVLWRLWFPYKWLYFVSLALMHNNITRAWSEVFILTERACKERLERE
jgi:hypothetical protein